MKMPRIMFAAPASGGGKTTLTCGVLQLLKNKGLRPRAFKCGPDYIDPLFHRSVLEVSSTNLDLFFTSPDCCRGLLGYYGSGGDIGVIEGVMGYYDGIALSHEASSWQLAVETKTPVILVVNPKGSALTTVSIIQGLAHFRHPSMIKGVFLNQCTEAFYQMLVPVIEKETGLPVVGYLPYEKKISVASGQTGLQLENKDAAAKVFFKTAEILEETLNLPLLLAIAKGAEDVFTHWEAPETLTTKKPIIAVAHDRAFPFYYRENWDYLRHLGGEIVLVSPLKDSALPKDTSALVMGGGFLGDYAEELSANKSFMASVRKERENGLPIFAEGAGFAYMHTAYKADASYPLVGIWDGQVSPSHRLGNFGYFNGQTEQLFGEKQKTPLRGHEFHYFSSTNQGSDVVTQKPQSRRSWQTGCSSDTLFAGFPYYYFLGNPQLAASFISKAGDYQKRGG